MTIPSGYGAIREQGVEKCSTLTADTANPASDLLLCFTESSTLSQAALLPRLNKFIFQVKKSSSTALSSVLKKLQPAWRRIIHSRSQHGTTLRPPQKWMLPRQHVYGTYFMAESQTNNTNTVCRQVAQPMSIL